MYVHMHVCMHACVHVCIRVCMYTCMYVHMHVCTHACMHVCMYVCMHACMHACKYACRHFWRFFMYSSGAGERKLWCTGMVTWCRSFFFLSLFSMWYAGVVTWSRSLLTLLFRSLLILLIDAGLFSFSLLIAMHWGGHVTLSMDFYKKNAKKKCKMEQNATWCRSLLVPFFRHNIGLFRHIRRSLLPYT